MRKLLTTLLVMIIVGLTPKAHANPIFLASTTANTSPPTTAITATFTPGGALNNTLIVIGLFHGNSGSDAGDVVNGISVNGVRATVRTNFVAGTTGGWVTQWTFPATTTGNTIIQASTTAVGSVDAMIIDVRAYNGVDTTNPIEAAATSTGTSATPTLTISAATDTSLVVDDACLGSAFTTPNAAGAGQTQRLLANVSNVFACNNLGGSEQLGSVAGDVMSWSGSGSDSWRMSALSLRAASTGNGYSSFLNVFTDGYFNVFTDGFINLF